MNSLHPEKKLESGEGYEFYRQIYENSMDAILLTAPDGRILAANPAACAMFGQCEDDIKKVGRAGVVDVTDPQLRELLKKRDASGHVKGELIGIRKDGTRFPIEFSSSIFKDQHGESRTSMIIRDISERKRMESHLEQTNERLQALIENLPDAIYTFDLKERKTTNFNRTSFLGYSYEELNEPGYLLTRIHPDDVEEVSAYWQRVMRGEASESFEYRLQNKDEQWEWIDSRSIPIASNPDGTPKEIMVILRVITGRKMTEEQLSYHARILENVNDVIIGTDENFVIRYWNFAAEHAFGWKAEEVIGKIVGEVLRTVYSEGGREESIRQINETGMWKGEVIQFTKDERPLNIDANIMMIRNSAGKVVGFVSANRDITRRKQAEEKLQQAKDAVEATNAELQQALTREQLLARTDGLTGLFNRRHFFSLAEQVFAVSTRYRTPISVIIFDIDHFKLVNDRWGHHMGDNILKHIARISLEQVREADVLARYGGEEFIVLLPNSNADEAFSVAERIRKNVMSYRIDPKRTQAGITVSAGIAEKSMKMTTLDHLIRCADQALYTAKESGRNCVKIYRGVSWGLG